MMLVAIATAAATDVVSCDFHTPVYESSTQGNYSK